VEVNGIGKHSSLSRYGNNYSCKESYSTGWKNFALTNDLAYSASPSVMKKEDFKIFGPGSGTPLHLQQRKLQQLLRRLRQRPGANHIKHFAA
jgi:hypothetical protein